MNFRFAGSGPGVQTLDGSSVELYRRLSYLGELEDHRSLFENGARVLELGAGAGRLTRRLLEWGARVTAVDNSPHMLAAVPEGASRVLSDIESLNLAERFDVAILAGCLVNHPAPEMRAALIRSAHRHLGRSAHLLLERFDPDWLLNAQPGPPPVTDGLAVCVEAVDRTGVAVQMTVRYELAGSVWRQSFAAARLSEEDIERLLSDCGFGSFAWSGERRRWLRAVVQ